jgi:DNA-binding LacI/PurR family transcriptional regulator
MTRTPSRRLADVAKKVGVSEATVSRVLNGKPGVSDSTREAVLAALDVLGYERPTQLRGERARLIGLVLPELQNPIFPAIAEVVGSALAQRGFTPVLCTLTEGGGLSESDYVSMLLEQQVSGVMFAAGHYAAEAAPHEHYQLLHERGIPVVVFSAAIEQLRLPCVSTDDVTAAGQAFTHLASLGHQRIGLVVGPEDHGPSQRQLAGRAHPVFPGRRAGRDHPPAQARRNRRDLRQRRARARRDPSGPAGRPVGAGRRVSGGL